MTFGTSKEGGDVNQLNIGSQGNVSAQELTGVASVGPAAVGSLGGAAFAAQGAAQLVGQHLSQANVGAAGDAGSDNVQADTNVTA